MLKELVRRARERTRERRASLFFKTIAWLPRPARVIDLGGTAALWREWGLREGDGLSITLLNREAPQNDHGDRPGVPFISELAGEAADLGPLELRRYDLIFSSALLERLPEAGGRARLCQSIQASGRPYFIQVLNDGAGGHAALSVPDLRTLFPSATLVKERAFGLTRSVVVHGRLSYRGETQSARADLVEEADLFGSATVGAPLSRTE
jgi:hypothetical protein